MLKRIKQGFSAQEGIWKPSLPLLCQGTLFSHPGSYKTIWISLTRDMVNQQHSRWSFCHPSLCYMILVTEWQVLEGRWLKYLTRVGPPWNHITWVKPASPFNSRLKTRLRTKVFPSHWGPGSQGTETTCAASASLSPAQGPVSGIFNNSLMQEALVSQVCKEPVLF